MTIIVTAGFSYNFENWSNGNLQKLYTVGWKTTWSFPIKMLHWLRRGKYIAFKLFLQSQGISFRHRYRHTHHQNWVVERTHRFVSEISLIFLAHMGVGMAKSTWEYCVQLFFFLINNLPTPILSKEVILWNRVGLFAF